MTEELEDIALQTYETIVSGRLNEYEDEADRIGLRYAARSGYDPQSLVNLLTRMRERTGLATANTHYSSRQIQERLDRVRSHVAGMRRPKKVITESARYQRVLQALR